MPDEVKAPAPVERRVAALERAFEERNRSPGASSTTLPMLPKRIGFRPTVPMLSLALGPIRISGGGC